MRYRKIGVVVFVFVLTLIMYHRWFSLEWFAFGDWNIYFSQSLVELSVQSAWVGNTSFGNFDVISWKYPYYLLQSFFGFLGFDSNISDKFVILLPFAFFSLMAPFLVLKKCVRSDISALIGSMAFAYSSYFLAINTQGHQHLSIAGVWGVLALYFCMLLVEKKHIKWAVFAGMMLALAGYYDFRFAYIFFFVCVGFLFVSWVGEVRRGREGELVMKNEKLGMQKREEEGGEMLDPRLRGGEKGCEREKEEMLDTSRHGGITGERKGAWNIFWMSGVFVAIFAGLNIFWILPFAVSGTATSENSALGRDLFGNDYFELDDAMYLSHPFWTGYGVKWFRDQPTPWWLSLLTILVWIGFWVGVRGGRNEKLIMKNEELGMKKREEEGGETLDLRLRGGEKEGAEGEKEGAEGESETRRRKYILFFAFVALIGILLGKQVSEPFPTLYYWLYENIPGFNAFREASKFYVLIALGYAVGIASLVDWLLPKKTKNER